jgi:TonB family protein
MPQSLIRARIDERVSLSFDVDADGRPFNIHGSLPATARFYATDLMPSLRASHFQLGQTRRDCSITYAPKEQEFADAPLGTIALLGVAQRTRMDSSAWNRIASGDCRTGVRASPLRRAFPDWRKLARREGVHNWSYVRFDIDQDGVPFAVSTVISSGYAELDAEAQRVATEGRFASGPRSGCAEVWWTGPEVLPAPAMPSKSEFPSNEACEIPDRWMREPRLVYPRAYNQRAIEGWAVLRYDVAPWGEVGSIEVLAAQPSSEIGEAAKAVLANAQFKPLDAGLSGCVDRVIFKIGSREPGAEQASSDFATD